MTPYHIMFAQYSTCSYHDPYQIQCVCASSRDDPLPSLLILLGFTMIAATGPFTTSDNLEMGALRDLMEVVKREKPDLLILVNIN